MTPFQELFVLEYLRDFNGAQAYVRAGGSKNGAAQAASLLLTHIEVAEQITAARAERAERVMMQAVDVLNEWVQIATADPNELVSHRWHACRHCYGRGFKYQWRDEAEWLEACEASMVAFTRAQKRDPESALLEMPSADGGFGFSRRLAPNPECPKCDGVGDELVQIADTRKLKGPAKRLYAGIKQTKDGIQVLMRDQDAALLQVARHLGMLNDKLNLGGSVSIAVDEKEALKKLSTDELRTLMQLREKMG